MVEQPVVLSAILNLPSERPNRYDSLDTLQEMGEEGTLGLEIEEPELSGRPQVDVLQTPQSNHEKRHRYGHVAGSGEHQGSGSEGHEGICKRAVSSTAVEGGTTQLRT